MVLDPDRVFGASTEVRPGDRIFAAGYAVPGDYGSVLQDAVVKVLEHGSVPEPKQIQPENTLDPRWHARWVQLNARLLSHHLGTDRSQTLTLQFPGCVFEANCQLFWSENAIPAPGTLLNLKGDCEPSRVRCRLHTGGGSG